MSSRASEFTPPPVRSANPTEVHPCATSSMLVVTAAVTLALPSALRREKSETYERSYTSAVGCTVTCGEEAAPW